MPPQLLGFYDANASGVTHQQDWDALKVAIPFASFIMAPLDSTLVNYIGTPAQVCLIPNGSSTANFDTFGLPCWQTGLVDTFVVWDEPTSGADITNAQAMATHVKSVCTGTNKKGIAVRTAVTHYDPVQLNTLAGSGFDILAIDRYPANTNYSGFTADLETNWRQCVLNCESAVAAANIKEFWIVLDCFFASPTYPFPTKQNLLDQISAAQNSNATRLIGYTWGAASAAVTSALSANSDLVSALNTVTGLPGTIPTPTLPDDFSVGISTGWSSPIFSGDFAMQSDGSGHAKGNGSGQADSYWKPQTFGPNCYVQMQMITPPATSSGNFAYLFLRVTNPNTASMTGYGIGVKNDPGVATFNVWKLTAGTWGASVGSSTGSSIAAGDVFKATATGNNIVVTVNGNTVLSVNDSTYTTAGYIGFGDAFQTGIYDNVAGGNPIKPYLYPAHTGLSRINNIEQWLLDNTSFVLSGQTGLDRISNIEQWLIYNPVGATNFVPYGRAGTDRMWAIEEYLLQGSGSNG
jgi:hypothetical protein